MLREVDEVCVYTLFFVEHTSFVVLYTCNSMLHLSHNVPCLHDVMSDVVIMSTMQQMSM